MLYSTKSKGCARNTMIEHYGTFDVSNYGDLLFPLILRERLSLNDFSFQTNKDSGESAVQFISPLGGPAPIPGGVSSRPPPQLSASPAVPSLSGLIIGGGHLIHASPSTVEAYRSPPELALQAYPRLWLGSSERALQHGAPLIWNAPGVPAALPENSARLLAWSLSFCDYVSVRDARSLRLIREAGFDGAATVVPDTAHDLPKVFSARTLEDAYASALESRNAHRPEKTIAIHVNERHLGEELGFVAQRIDRICRQADAVPVLLAIGACHGDDLLTAELGRLMKSNPLVVDHPESLAALASSISHASAYIGSSLHGAITACAFGTPAMIVAREGEDGGKFSEYFGAHGLGHWLMSDWAEAEARSAEFQAADPEPWRAVLPKVGPQLDRHWALIKATLEAPPSYPKQRETAQMRLDQIRRDVIAPLGAYAALLPDQARSAVQQQKTISTLKSHAKILKASYREKNRKLRRRLAQYEDADRPPETKDPSDT
ncbi:MAG: polysaccharide pyruvyl transferase family protein [Myxococcota bacterium]